MKFSDYFLDEGDIVKHLETGSSVLVTNIHDDHWGTRYEIKFPNSGEKRWVTKDKIRLLCPIG